MGELYLLKVDSCGKIEWERVYGDPDRPDHGNSVLQTSDSSYVVVGAKWLPGGHDAWLLELDKYGDTLWTRNFGSDRWDSGFYIRQTREGGFIFTGQKRPADENTDLWLVKTNSAGELEWDRTYGGSQDDFGWCVKETGDGYIITGYTTDSALGECLWLVKTDKAGDTLWTRTYGNGGEHGYSVETAPGDGYVILGTTDSYGSGGTDLWLLRTDGLGDTLWSKTYGRQYNEQAGSIIRTREGGYFVTGSTQGQDSLTYDLWMLSLNDMGDTLRTQTLGGPGSGYGHCVVQTADGGFAITGETNSDSDDGLEDIWIVKIDSIGDTLQVRAD
jgi:hypothetical protein